jgi:hypothetical protein
MEITIHRLSYEMDPVGFLCVNCLLKMGIQFSSRLRKVHTLPCLQIYDPGVLFKLSLGTKVIKMSLACQWFV